MELGIYSFGELIVDPSRQSATSLHERFDQVIQLATLADQGGLDLISLGEHHRSDFNMSAPEIVLAAIAGVTSRLRLAGGATVLSSQDPVRVFQQFATLDQISNGRADIVVGRGAFTESFPLFGYNISDYDELFDEKLRLLVRLRDEERVTWSGKFRSPLKDAEVTPRPFQEVLPIWVGIGGTPASAVRAGALGLPMMMGFFASPEQFVSRVHLYRRAAEQAGHDLQTLRLGAGGHLYVGKKSQTARDEFYPYYSRYLNSMTHSQFPREAYDAWIASSLPVGSPQQVIDAIMLRVELLGIDRFTAQIDVGNLPWSMTLDSLELYMTEVAPVVKRETALVAS
jgi:alkanesulfonate monooxygenase SsuD/methylene tetrahydromethanopterin reductase-like flavin-dependent oxidoreductase (luciferase family)